MIEFIEEVSEDTSIGWWNENRRRLNEAIKWYNEYVENKNRSAELVLAKVHQIRKFGETNEFSRWQFDILDEIESKINRERDGRRDQLFAKYGESFDLEVIRLAADMIKYRNEVVCDQIITAMIREIDEA
jgi:hypothetical protein